MTDEKASIGLRASTLIFLYYLALRGELFLGPPVKGTRVALGLGAGLFYIPGATAFSLLPRLYFQGQSRFSLGIGYNFPIGEVYGEAIDTSEASFLVLHLLWQVGKEKRTKRPRTPK